MNEIAIYLEHLKAGVTPRVHKQQVFKTPTLSTTTINVTGYHPNMVEHTAVRRYVSVEGMKHLCREIRIENVANNKSNDYEPSVGLLHIFIFKYIRHTGWGTRSIDAFMMQNHPLL